MRFTFAPDVLGDYRVVYTDYDNFAIVYSCRSINYSFAKSEQVWILTRELEPSLDIINFAKVIVKERLPDYDQSLFRVTKHGPLNKCKYLPAPALE